MNLGYFGEQLQSIALWRTACRIDLELLIFSPFLRRTDLIRRIIICFVFASILPWVACHKRNSTVLNNVEITIQGVRRATEWTDPRWANNPPEMQRMLPHIQVSQPGWELAVLKISTKRLQPNAKVVIENTCAYDASGKKYLSPITGQDEFGSNEGEET